MGGKLNLTLSWSLIFLSVVLGHFDLDLPQWRECPQMLPRILVGFTPRGNVSAGIFKKSKDAENIESCVEQCCSQPSCNIVFMFKQQCYQVRAVFPSMYVAY